VTARAVLCLSVEHPCSRCVCKREVRRRRMGAGPLLEIVQAAVRPAVNAAGCQLAITPQLSDGRKPLSATCLSAAASVQIHPMLLNRLMYLSVSMSARRTTL
jgi:hypothetical protein